MGWDSSDVVIFDLGSGGNDLLSAGNELVSDGNELISGEQFSKWRFFCGCWFSISYF